MPQFRKKSVVIEAMHYDGSTSVYEWIKDWAEADWKRDPIQSVSRL